jgi:hypothetical protein
VLDTLAQHHPEYVALAWGALKFVFAVCHSFTSPLHQLLCQKRLSSTPYQGILNHAELVVKLSRALANIADVLPRIKLDGALYPTEHMKQAISRVYAHIILFLQKAVKWYTRSTAYRAISALLKPYDLTYKDTIEQIRACTDAVNEIANTAARAETRALSITIHDQAKQLKESDKTLHEMQHQLKDLQACSLKNEVQLGQILQVATSKQD